MIDLVAEIEQAKIAARTRRPLRTERTLRDMAKDVADLIWDDPMDLFKKKIATIEEAALFEKITHYLQPQDWSEGWNRTYRAMWQHQKIHRQLCWPRFYKLSRSMAAEMLGRSDISVTMRDRIYDAIIEDRAKS